MAACCTCLGFVAPSADSEENVCFSFSASHVLGYFTRADDPGCLKVTPRKSFPRVSSGPDIPTECVSDIIALSGLEGSFTFRKTKSELL